MIKKLLLSSVLGFTLHRFYEPTKEFGERWGNIMRYAIGGLALIPSKVIIFLELINIIKYPDKPKEEIKKTISLLVVSDLLSLLALGLGSFLGHIFDGLDIE